MFLRLGLDPQDGLEVVPLEAGNLLGQVQTTHDAKAVALPVLGAGEGVLLVAQEARGLGFEGWLVALEAEKIVQAMAPDALITPCAPAIP